MIVLDASAIVELLSGSTTGRSIGDRLRRSEVVAHVPELAAIEVAQVLRRLVRVKDLTAPRAETALRQWARLPAVRHRHAPLLGRIWELRANLTAYDATYVALAERLDMPLLTVDRRLARSTAHRATIELVR